MIKENPLLYNNVEILRENLIWLIFLSFFILISFFFNLVA